MEDSKCVVKTCESVTNNLFCSPADEDMLKKWQEILGIEDKYFLVCENHFSNRDIVIEKCLEHAALPSLDITDQQPTIIDNDSCGICLEKLENKCQLSKQESDDFKAITGYQPVKENICESCENFLKTYHKFKTEIKEKHKKLRFQENMDESEDDCVVVLEDEKATDKPSGSKSVDPVPKLNISHPKLPPGIISRITAANTAKPLFKCKHCYYKTNERSSLIDHIDMNHYFPCIQCPFISSNKPLLTLHINKFHSTDSTSIVCGICEETFFFKNEIDEHYEKAHKEQACSYFMCFYCKTNCKTDVELKYHYGQFHPNGLTTAQHQINNTKLQLALLIGKKERKSDEAKEKSYNEIMKRIKNSVTVKKICKKKKRVPKQMDIILPLNTPIKIPKSSIPAPVAKTKMPITEVTIVTRNNYMEDNVETPQSVSNSEDDFDNDAISIDDSDSDYEVQLIDDDAQKSVKKHDINSILQQVKPGENSKPFKSAENSNAAMYNNAFRCLTCNKYFEDVGKLLNHRELYHPPEEKFKSYEEFDMSTVPDDPYKVERKKTSEEDGPRVICDICKMFVQERNIERHKQRHTDKPFLCHICSSIFADQTSFKYHMMKHEPETLFQCDMCDKGYVTKGKLTKHIKRSHLKIPNIKCQCPICNKKLYNNKRANILEVHMNKYHPDGKDDGYRVNEETNYYDCERCGASYWDLYTFVRHSCDKGRLQVRCLDCMMPCSNQESLAKHKITKCRKINPFTNSISLRDIAMAKSKPKDYPYA